MCLSILRVASETLLPIAAKRLIRPSQEVRLPGAPKELLRVQRAQTKEPRGAAADQSEEPKNPRFTRWKTRSQTARPVAVLGLAARHLSWTVGSLKL